MENVCPAKEDRPTCSCLSVLTDIILFHHSLVDTESAQGWNVTMECVIFVPNLSITVLVLSVPFFLLHIQITLPWIPLSHSIW